MPPRPRVLVRGVSRREIVSSVYISDDTSQSSFVDPLPVELPCSPVAIPNSENLKSSLKKSTSNRTISSNRISFNENTTFESHDMNSALSTEPNKDCGKKKSMQQRWIIAVAAFDIDEIRSIMDVYSAKKLERYVTLEGNCALHIACTNSNFEICELLIAKNFDMNKPNYNGSTPLHMAIKAGSLRIVDLFLRSGADTSILDANSLTPLLLALKLHRKRITKLMCHEYNLKIREHEVTLAESVCKDANRPGIISFVNMMIR